MKKGDKVYIVEIRRRAEPIIHEKEILSVGTKYITVNIYDGRETRFSKQPPYRQDTNYTPDYSMYFNVQEYHDSVELNKLRQAIQSETSGYSFKPTLETARKLAEILNIEVPSTVN